MRIEAIAPRQKTANQVVGRLSGAIKGHKLTAGERLPGEHDLVEQLKVNRPVLREALTWLQCMGVVNIQRCRGTFVGGATSVRAVREHDSDAADDAMQQHMQAVLERLAKDAL